MRIEPVRPEEMTDLQRRIVEDIERGPRGKAGELMLLWLHSPALADVVQKVGAYFRVGTSLPQHIMELVILITARHWRCGYEWVHHEPLARKKGLDGAVIDAIRRGERPAFADPAAAAAYEYTRSMLETQDASDEVVMRVRETLGASGFIDLSILIGHYVHGAIVIKGAALGLPAGTNPPFPDD